MATNDTWVRDAVLARLSGRPLALLFGYDGVLAPLAEHPAQAALPEPVHDWLRRLARTPGLSVGVISGRALADVRAMAGLDHVYLAGCGGCELDLRGESVTMPVTTEERR